MGYLEMVKADAEQYISDNHDLEFEILNGEYADVDEIAERLNDEMWIEDSVTGNASGSYTFNRYEAQEAVMDDLDDVIEAFEEAGYTGAKFGELAFSGDWETIDVITRCHFLSQAIAEIMEENEDTFEELFERYEQEQEEEEDDNEEMSA